MTVLIAFASKYGATQAIAERIATTLRKEGIETICESVKAARNVENYTAVIMGSALYYGAWLKEATDFVRHHQAVLAERPVWLFSSGPLGTEVKDSEHQPKELPEFEQTIHPREHRIFFGALDHLKISLPERMVLKAVRAAEGDFRDWDAIDAWAQAIAQQLQQNTLA